MNLDIVWVKKQSHAGDVQGDFLSLLLIQDVRKYRRKLTLALRFP